MQPDLRCYYHPDREAGGQCDRCGDYLCVQCVREHEELQGCPTCLSYLTRPELPKLIRYACLLNLVAIVVVIPWLMMGMFGRMMLDMLVALEVPIVFSSIVLAMAGWSEKRDAAGKLQVSVLLLSCLPPIFFFGCLLDGTWGPPDGEISVLAWLAAGALFLVSFIFWLWAVIEGVKPLWAVIVSLATMLAWPALLGFVAYVFFFVLPFM